MAGVVLLAAWILSAAFSSTQPALVIEVRPPCSSIHALMRVSSESCGLLVVRSSFRVGTVAVSRASSFKVTSINNRLNFFELVQDEVLHDWVVHVSC